MRRDKPQLYGTQFVKEDDNAQLKRYKIDTTKVRDEEREYYNVETLVEQQQKG